MTGCIQNEELKDADQYYCPPLAREPGLAVGLASNGPHLQGKVTYSCSVVRSTM
jgi:hypothetical protein